MTAHKKLSYQFRVTYNTKKPIDKYSEISKDNEVNTNQYNVAVCTGKKNNLTVVDLDIYKWSENHPFYEKFGKDLIQAFKTLTQETPRGGIHLFFKHDVEVIQTQNNFLQIDIRNEGGFIMMAPSVFEDKPYKIINNTQIRTMPDELKEWLLSNMYTKQQKERIEKTKNGTLATYKGTYKYLDTPEEILKRELESLPFEYLDDGNQWWKFTAFMKAFNKKELWDTLSKKSNKYNSLNNEQRWKSINLKYNFAFSILKGCKSSLLDLIQFKPIPEDNKKPSEIINIDKLGKGIKLTSEHTVIKSDTGTGKTTLVKEYIKEKKIPFISLVSRVSLADEQERVFKKAGINCTHYANIKSDIDEDLLESYISTIDSIKKINCVDISKYVLFLDEFNSLIEYIIKADKILANKRISCLSTLVYFIKNCKQVIASDADISDVCFKFLEYCGIKYKYVFNEYKHNSNIEAVEVENLNKLINLIKRDEKYIVCTDSKTVAEKIYIALEEKGTLYTSDNKESINIEEELNLIISPKIIYGNDSNIGRNVYCYYKGETISPSNMVQQINRERKINKLYFCFESRKFRMPMFDSSEDCKQYISIKNKKAIKEFSLVNMELNNLYVQLLEMVDYKYDCYQTNKYAHLIDILRSRGFSVSQFYGKVKKLNKKDLECVQEWKEENEIYLNDVYKDVRKILSLKNEEEIEKYKDVIINPNKLIDHFNICTYLIKDTPDKKLIERVKELDDFPIKKIEADFIKMKVLREFSDKTGFIISDSNQIQCTKGLTEKESKKMNESIKYTFGFKRKDIDFTNKQKCSEQVYMCYKNLFGDVVNKKRVRDGDKSVMVYSLCDLSYHSELLNKRAKIIKSFDGCLIE